MKIGLALFVIICPALPLIGRAAHAEPLALHVSMPPHLVRTLPADVTSRHVVGSQIHHPRRHAQQRLMDEPSTYEDSVSDTMKSNPATGQSLAQKPKGS